MKNIRGDMTEIKRKWQIDSTSVFWMFTVGSIAGFFLEGIWHILRKGTWESHSTLVWGPFCIIYGVGLVLIYLLTDYFHDRNIAFQISMCMTAGALVEYFGSLLQEMCIGTVSWNYSRHFLNIGGRVSLKMTLLWGILGILFIKLVYPKLSKLVSGQKKKCTVAVTRGCMVFMAINMLVSFAALSRWEQRRDEIPASGPAAVFLDQHFDDNFMEKQYPNMVFVKSEED